MLTLAFNLKPSRFYLYSLVISLLLSVLALLITTATIWLKAVVFILVIAYGLFLYRNDISLRHQQAILSLTHQGKSEWLIKTREKEFQGRLLGSSTVTRFVSILRFQVANKRFPIATVIFADALSKEDYRRLMLATQFGR